MPIGLGYEAACGYYKEFASLRVSKGAVWFRQNEAQLGRDDLFYLLTRLLRRPDADHPWLYDRCNMVQEEPDGCLDLWSREHYKSTIITLALTIQDIIRDPNVTIGIFSHTRKIAKAFLQQIMREFEDNQPLKKLYPDILWTDPRRQAPKWSEEDGIIVRRETNPKESTVEAWGLVDNQPTGRHFLIRVYDDTVTRDSVTTPDQIKKTTSAWELSENLGVKEESGGRARYIGTRYSLFDTYATMLERGAVTPRIFPATHNGQMTGTPVFFSQQEWEKRVRNQSRAMVAAQLLQNPMADSDAMFRAEWLRPYEVRPRTMNVYIMVDPSMGRSSTSDNTAMAVIGVSSQGGKYLLDGFCHRMQLSERWTRMRDLYRKWSAADGIQHVAVGYERYGMQSDLEYFEERQIREKVHFAIDELNWTRDNTESKQERVARLEPDFRNGRFYVPLSLFFDGKPHFWSVVTDKESKEYNTIKYHEAVGLTSAQMDTIKGGSPHMVAKAIKCMDSDGRLYDLTKHFFEEYTYFPFGRWRDLIDATSRVFDMEPIAPTLTSQHARAPAIYFDM